MKKLFSLLLAAGMVPGVANAEIQYVTDATHGCDFAGAAELDINNDGILDVIYGGRANGDLGRIVYDADENEMQVAFNAWKMIWNKATNSYDITENSQNFGIKPYIIPADFNGDGIMDYFASSESNADIYADRGMFIGDGTGNFTKQELTIVDAEGNPYDWRPRAIDIADFNLDGRPDIVGRM